MFYKGTASSYVFVQNIFFMHSLHSSSHSYYSYLSLVHMCAHHTQWHTNTTTVSLSPSHTHKHTHSHTHIHKHHTCHTNTTHTSHKHHIHKHHTHKHINSHRQNGTQTPLPDLQVLPGLKLTLVIINGRRHTSADNDVFYWYCTSYSNNKFM